MAKRIKLTDEQRRRFIDLAWESYNAVGYDCWQDRIPSKANFLDVIGQQMFDGAPNARKDMTNDERTLWLSLPDSTKRTLMLEVM